MVNLKAEATKIEIFEAFELTFLPAGIRSFYQRVRYLGESGITLRN